LLELRRGTITQGGVKPLLVVHLLDEMGKPFDHILDGFVVSEMDFSVLQGEGRKRTLPLLSHLITALPP